MTKEGINVEAEAQKDVTFLAQSCTVHNTALG